MEDLWISKVCRRFVPGEWSIETGLADTKGATAISKEYNSLTLNELTARKPLVKQLETKTKATVSPFHWHTKDRGFDPIAGANRPCLPAYHALDD